MVNKISTVKQRIVQLIETKGVVKEKFFKKIGVTSANFRGNASLSPIGSDTLENIFSEFPDVNLEWILTGQGPMFKTDEEKAKGMTDRELLHKLLAEKDKRIEELNNHIADLQKQFQADPKYKSNPGNAFEAPGHKL